MFYRNIKVKLNDNTLKPMKEFNTSVLVK